MSITPDKIRWGSYMNYEGPIFGGVQKFTLPDEPTEADRWLAVITAAEGGKYDAINMYDRGIVSVGLIQWIEAGQFSVSNMLGLVAETCGTDYVLETLKPALDACSATFKKNASGQWRFYVDGVEVNTQDKTRALFLGCSGLKGSWTPAAVTRAKLWAACIANIWESEEARRAQNKYTKDRLMGFVFPAVKSALFDDAPDSGWVGAMRAAYVSFAVNLPAVASAQFVAALPAASSFKKWGQNWCTFVLKQMIFGAKINVWPHRYDSIRPVLESLWGVTLPKNTKELSAWKPGPEEEATVPVTAEEAHEVPTEVIPEVEKPNIPPLQETNPESTSEQPVQPQEKQPEAIIPKPADGPQGVLGWILWLIQTIFFTLTKTKK